jgi:hypothetical protein
VKQPWIPLIYYNEIWTERTKGNHENISKGGELRKDIRNCSLQNTEQKRNVHASKVSCSGDSSFECWCPEQLP